MSDKNSRRGSSLFSGGNSKRFSLTIFSFIVLTGALCQRCDSEKKHHLDTSKFPTVLDDRLSLTVFAEDPDIVTPIGIAVDSSGLVYTLESHTHTPPADYGGPAGDRIKIFKDGDGNGTAEEHWIYAEGFQEGVNIAFSPEGDLYVVTSKGVYALRDSNADGIADQRKAILSLEEPEKVYAHAALLGITFSTDGWMYVSRGNTGSAKWRLTGTDGKSLTGYGDGGNIVRARLDGTELQEVATGFWNPADLKFDSQGNLFAADNDPDSRGPNRLVHVVMHGDYGYKSLYGESGIHPYLCWNGELPGKLPFAAPLGEAPSGLIDAAQAQLPEDYRGSMLASIWEERKIVKINLRPDGVSLRGSAEVIIEGPPDFRPVAFAASRDGDVYITDWVLRKYPNHGRGKIWKLSAPSETFAPGNAAPSNLQENLLKNIQTTDKMRTMIEALASRDVFVRHAAVIALADERNRSTLVAAAKHLDPSVRVGSLLAMQRGGYRPEASVLRALLNDDDQSVRKQALIFVGEEGYQELRPYLDECMNSTDVSGELFKTYLETVRHLQPGFISAYTHQSEPHAKSIRRSLPPGFLTNLIREPGNSPSLRALALLQLEEPEEHPQLLVSLLAQENDAILRREVVFTLASVNAQIVAEELFKTARDRSQESNLRADAIASLSWQPYDYSPEISRLLVDSSVDVQVEAARYIRLKSSSEKARGYFAAITDRGLPVNGALKEQVSLNGARRAKINPVPPSIDESQSSVHRGGDPERGRRVFYAPQTMCSACHAVNGRGGDLGPDLSKVALSKTRQQLLVAILDPSREISPEYQGWFIRQSNGETVQGRQIDIGESAIDLYTYTSGFQSYNKKDVVGYGMTTSSLMPAGLEDHLTESDLRDLLAFLEASAGIKR